MKVGIACEYMHKQKKVRSIIHHEVLTDILKKVMVTGLDPDGSGTLEDPYVPNKLGNWWSLANLKWGFAPIFIQVGGRLIARWGTGAGQFRGYCTDVTGLEKKVALAVNSKSGYEQFVRDLGKIFKKRDALNSINPKLPSYTRKALRVSQLDDRAAAAWSRRLLTGAESCGECPELASTLCSLFISEVARAPATFLISLMLLDLVETATTYGSGGAKTYTWKSMLMYGNERKIPGSGCRQEAARQASDGR